MPSCLRICSASTRDVRDLRSVMEITRHPQSAAVAAERLRASRTWLSCSEVRLLAPRPLCRSSRVKTRIQATVLPRQRCASSRVRAARLRRPVFACIRRRRPVAASLFVPHAAVFRRKVVSQVDIRTHQDEQPSAARTNREHRSRDGRDHLRREDGGLSSRRLAL